MAWTPPDDSAAPLLPLAADSSSTPSGPSAQGMAEGGPRRGLQKAAVSLAQRGVFIGTSSWKYPGWLGQLYTDERYRTRGRFSEARFNATCLAEYAEVFRTVCVDAAYYKFPDTRYLEGLARQVPTDFLFAFKATDEITLKRFSRLPRFGLRAGQPNEHFLDAERFVSAFLGPLQPFRNQVGLLIFEFSRFYPSDFARGRDFVEALDGFLGRIPAGWPYGVEIRNRGFLQAAYWETLRRHGVAHIYNSWEGMPPVLEQLAMPGSRTSPDLCGARFLLKPGRKYEEAVRQFSPYDRVKEVYPEGRAAGRTLLRQAAGQPGKGRTFIFVNNRFEGNALQTISALVQDA